MARQLKILSANLSTPERGERSVRVVVQHSDLKNKPLSFVEMTDDEATKLAQQLLTAVLHRKGIRTR